MTILYGCGITQNGAVGGIATLGQLKNLKQCMDFKGEPDPTPQLLKNLKQCFEELKPSEKDSDNEAYMDIPGVPASNLTFYFKEKKEEIIPITKL